MLGKRKRGGSAGGNAFRKVKPVEEITFDTNKREEYLAGFHKRKLQRIKYARDEAAKQEREDKIQQRKELREERKREVEEHVKAVTQALRKAEGGSESDEDGEADEDEWSGIQDASSEHVDREDRYEDSDEEEEATVTVEAVDITRDGFQPVKDEEDSDEGRGEDGEDAGPARQEEGTTDKKAKRVWTKEKPKVPKKKRKKFRYESLAERQKNRAVIKAVKAKKRARREGK